MAFQQSLFGPEPDPTPRRRRAGGVGPADVPEELCELAQLLPAHVRLGTSSWSFPGWTGLVWDRKASATTLAQRGLGPYAQHPLLRTVGVDRNYYAPVPVETYAGWAAEVPDDFRFLVKALDVCVVPRFPDHPRSGDRAGQRNPRFLDPDFAVEEVVGPLREGLGEKAGPLVFQFSPMDLRALGGSEAFLDRLQAFLARLPRAAEVGAEHCHAVEIRNAALLGPPYEEVLRSAGAVHCYNLHPTMPDLPVQLERVRPAEGQPRVVRWMLHRELQYRSALELYEPFDRLVDEDPRARRDLASLVQEHASVRNPAFVIVNNKAEGSSPLSVFGLARAIVAGH